MVTGLIGRHAREVRGFRQPKRSAGRRQYQTRHPPQGIARQITARQALKNGVVLAVDGYEFGAGTTHFFHEQPARHHERLFVGEQYTLARAHGGQGGQQSSRTDDGRHHHVGAVFGNRIRQRLGAAMHTLRETGARKCRAGLCRGGRIDQHDAVGPELPCLLDDGLPTAVGPQNGYAEPFRMHADDGQRAASDAARRAEDGDTPWVAHSTTPEPKRPKA